MTGDVKPLSEKRQYCGLSAECSVVEALKCEIFKLKQKIRDKNFLEDYDEMKKRAESAESEVARLKEESEKLKERGKLGFEEAFKQLHEKEVIKQQLYNIKWDLEDYKPRLSEAEARVAEARSLVRQLYFFDEDERDNIISALETAQNIGVFLDDLEESKANINRLWEIKTMLEKAVGGVEEENKK